MANVVGQKLYVNKDIDNVEYFDAPAIASRSYWATGGALIGTVTKEKVAGIGDTNTFMEVEKDGDKFYVIFNTREYYLSSTDSVSQNTPSTGNTSTTKNGFEKTIDTIKSLLDFFTKTKSNTSTSTGDTKEGGTGTDESNNSNNADSSTNPTLEFLKKNWLWFFPAIILIPLLIYLAIKKLSQPRINVQQPVNYQK